MTDNFLKLMKYISHRFKNLYEYKTLKKIVKSQLDTLITFLKMKDKNKF